MGGHWDEIGKLQFDFLVSRGMRRDSYLLDIACGALRLGVIAIPYLEPGHYLGIEKERSLVDIGLEKELGPRLRQAKQPNIVVSDAFDFEKLGQQADIAIAQSLFSHLPPKLIHLCLRNLLPHLGEGKALYATYFRVERPRANPETPHDHGYFAYTESEMLAFGTANGFEANYIGNWNHPREQVMVEYRRQPSSR